MDQSYFAYNPENPTLHGVASAKFYLCEFYKSQSLRFSKIRFSTFCFQVWPCFFDHYSVGDSRSSKNNPTFPLETRNIMLFWWFKWEKLFSTTLRIWTTEIWSPSVQPCPRQSAMNGQLLATLLPPSFERRISLLPLFCRSCRFK